MKQKALLDTNIIIHREAKYPAERDIGKLYGWLDKLGFEKCIHSVTIDEIRKMQDQKNKDGFLIKLESYTQLQTTAPFKDEVKEVSKRFDKTENDYRDTTLINELYSGRVDLLITEDRAIHKKAEELGISNKVFTIDQFLEKVTVENPDLVEYKVPTVKKAYFGEVNLSDEFFDSFKEDYKEYDKWFNKKANEVAYVVETDDKIQAFLYIKKEDDNESYRDIEPAFLPKQRLKIGTFKVQLNGYKLGERLLKIVFDNALRLKVDEIYVTIFPKRIDQKRLIQLLEDFGFYFHGNKSSLSGQEEVYVRDFSKTCSLKTPKTTYPFVSRKARKFLVPIYPEYHTNLFPDSILRTESPVDFVDNEPHRNAISKVYVSRAINHDLKTGDLLIFYRTGGIYKSVVTTIGIVENLHYPVKDLDSFLYLCKKRSVFSDKELEELWNYSTYNHPFVVDFLYSYSFPRRINLKGLIDLGIIKDVNSAPRGFEQISNESFEKIIKESDSDEDFVVD